MKTVLFFVFIFSSLFSSAQKPSNLFVATELNNTDYGFSVVHSRKLFRSNVGVGAGLEFIDIGQKKLGGIMPSFDLRYYVGMGRSTFIPLAQIGYNIYQFRNVHPDPNMAYEMSGGKSFSLGLGYAYRLTKKGGGPFAALKYRSLQYRITSPVLPKTNTMDGLKISVGWRF